MKIDKTRVLEVIRSTLSAEQLKGSLVFWDTRVHEEGEELGIGSQTLTMPFAGTLVFVDLAPAYNWAHPCLYIFIDRITEKTQVMKESFPPFMGTPDENYVILLRYGEIPPHERYFAVFDRNEPLKR
jgi:hypothetical protein